MATNENEKPKDENSRRSGHGVITRRLTVVPERCSGCRLCEVACALVRFGVNNPKKGCLRVMMAYPHPVIRMPIICHQCREPKCAENCPTDAIQVKNGIVEIDEDACISCNQCVISCPFGAMFTHADIDTPFKCDLCGGDPECVKICPKRALLFVPEHLIGEEHRVTSLLKYTHMKEIEYVEKGEKKILKYADIERLKREDQRGILQEDTGD
jgi:carbon-monoxide dehydrogenase iron sulfur subunit